MKDRETENRQAGKAGREIDQTSESRLSRRRQQEPFAAHLDDFFSNPFAVMRRMHDEMDRMFASALGQQRGGTSAMGGLGSWAPAIEISRKENEINVCAELPGLRPEDVKIEVTDNALVIEGERRQEKKDEEGGRWHSERHYGRFFRSIPLPEGGDTEKARADFQNGELRVTVPVQAPQSNRRQIPISGSGGQTERK